MRWITHVFKEKFMGRKRGLIQGVGINDADYQTSRSVYGPKGTVPRKCTKLFECPYYKRWVDMLMRCYNKNYQLKFPTYVGCYASDEWLHFSKFREWMVEQNWKGKELDKDLLVLDNKVYSKETCVFISGAINSFFHDNGSRASTLPSGVSAHGDRYRTKGRNPFTKTQDHLGMFDCPNEAHKAWKAHKHMLSCKYAEQETDPRVVKALITRYI